MPPKSPPDDLPEQETKCHTKHNPGKKKTVHVITDKATPLTTFTELAEQNK